MKNMAHRTLHLAFQCLAAAGPERRLGDGRGSRDDPSISEGARDVLKPSCNRLQA